MVTQTQKGGKEFLLKLGNGIATASAVTFQNTGETVTLNNHGLVAGQQVKFATVVTTTTITTSQVYYVVNPLTNTFQVALTAGGSAVAIDADGTGTMNEYFQTIGGLRSTSWSLSSEGVDITNHESAEWSEQLDGAGIRSAELSGDGVFVSDVTMSLVIGLATSRLIRNWQVWATSTPNYWSGAFRVDSFEHTGDYNNEQTYSISLSSNGAVSYT